MNVHTAGRIDLSACTAQCADNLLQLFHLSVFQLGGVQLNFILARSRGTHISFRVNTCVPNDFPLFTVQIFDTVGIVATAGMLGAGAKQVGQRLGCRGAVYPG